MNKKIINGAHYLMGVRFDNWIRLLWQNRFKINARAVWQALLISVVSFFLFPFAILEALVFAVPIHRAKIKDGPVYIIGHWRSGTTYLQNLMSKDPRFGWFDPVNTATFPNCLFFPRIMAAFQKNLLKNARPMDNVQYALDLPMEETFAQATISPLEIIQMISFPNKYEDYIKAAFIADLSPHRKKEWYSSYDYILKKLTYIKKSKVLLLKSPDNTCRVKEIKEKYPKAKFVNIYRNPYAVIISTVNMFLKQMELLSFQKMPEEEHIEDEIIGIFKRMYTELFEYSKTLSPYDFVEVKYEDFELDPEKGLKMIYKNLCLPDFDKAFQEMERHIVSQKNYKKNSFQISDRLKNKINDKLGFYFDHYGYKME